MTNAFGGMYITGGTLDAAPAVAAAALAPATNGWAAIAAGNHGDLSVVPTVATGKLTLKPGVYKVHFDASVEFTDTSTTSEAGVTNEVTFQFRKDGAAITGAKAIIDCADFEGVRNVSLDEIIEVAASDTGAIQVFISAGLTVDMIVREGHFNAVRLN